MAMAAGAELPPGKTNEEDAPALATGSITEKIALFDDPFRRGARMLVSGYSARRHSYGPKNLEDFLLITLSRRLAYDLHRVVRRALNVSLREAEPPLELLACDDGLRIRARGHQAAVEYHLHGPLPAERLLVPMRLLADCEGKVDDPVQIDALTDGRVVAGWRYGELPQLVQVEPPNEPQACFPAQTGASWRFTENPPGVLRALAHACQTTSNCLSSRYALGSVQLRGDEGAIVATDGRQMLIQRGFAFPWQESLLMPANEVFASTELGHDEAVRVGRSAEWISFEANGYRIFLRIDTTGQFPEVDACFRNGKEVIATLNVAPQDAERLLRSLPQLPQGAERDFPVTVELNGKVLLRAKQEGRRQPIEIVLSSSRSTGEAVSFSTNRRYLARAVALGFREFSLFGANAPVLCQDEHRHYVWSVLDPCRVVPPGHAKRLVSPSGEPPDNKQKPAAVTGSLAERAAALGDSPQSFLGATGAAPRSKPSGSSATIREKDVLGRMRILESVLRDCVRQCQQLQQAIVDP